MDSKKAKIAIAALTIVCVVLLFSLIGVAVHKSKSSGSDGSGNIEPDVCGSTECIETAKTFYSNMDESVNPCDNFYQFICGGWKSKNPRGPNDQQFSRFSKLIMEETRKIINILSGKGDGRHPLQSGAMKTANDYFDSCFSIKKNSIEVLRELYDVVTENQNIPILSSYWDESRFDWQSTYVNSSSNFGEQPFFNFTVDSFTRNISYIKISAPKYFMVGHILEDPNLSQDVKDKGERSLRNVLTALVRLLIMERGISVHANHIRNVIDDAISLERNLVKIGVPYYKPLKQSETIDVNYATFRQKYPQLKLDSILTEIFKLVNIKLSDNDIIQINDVSYFENLASVLGRTEQKTLANYMGLKILHGFGAVPFQFAVFGVDTEQHAVLCQKMAEKLFGLALSRYYVKYYLDNSTVEEMKAFVTVLKAAFTQTLQSNEWMDDRSKLFAQLKLNRMIGFIAIPSWIANDDDVNKLFSDMDSMQSNTFVRNQRAAISWLQKQMNKQLRPNNESLVDIIRGGPSEVNAYNSLFENIFRVKIGILNKPFYYHNSPLAVNFGGIGFILGHEMLHGFDNKGATHDYKGHLKFWWTNETWEVYEKKVQCFVDQYNAFTEPVTGLKVNGTLTTGENIADNGGIFQSYVAYKMYAALSKPELDKKLPLQMSKYTKDQLFYIAFANVYCNNDSPDSLRIQLRTDVHSPFYARVMVPLQNSQHFSQTFQCKIGSKMNPNKKCVLW